MTYRKAPLEGLAALGDPTRRTIFERVAAKPSAVGELARELPVSRPAVSQHLKVLRNSQILTMNKQAQKRYYQINPAAFEELEQWSRRMKETWTARLGQLDSLLNEDW